MAINLIGTPVEGHLENQLKHLAQGNKGNADVTELTLEDNGDLKFHVDIKHKHKTNGIQVYSVNTSANGHFNVAGGGGSLRVCVSSPVGDICQTVSVDNSIIKSFLS